MDNEKKLILSGKTFILHKAPATVAYDASLRYYSGQQALKDGKGADDKGIGEIQKAFYKLLRYVDVDLGDGRVVPLDNEEIVNQHITNVNDLIRMQKEVVEFNFGFFETAAPLNSSNK